MKHLRQIVVFVVVLAAVIVGGTKPSVRITFLTHFTSTGELKGPTNVIASASAAAAVSAVVASTTNMLTIASNIVAWASNDISYLEIEATNMHIAWITGDAAKPLTDTNLVCRAELLSATSTSSLLVASVVFNQQPSAAPTLLFECSADGTNWVTCAITNSSYPTMYPVTTPQGVSSCLQYTVSIPAQFAHLPVIPTREITFGNALHPLDVSGAIMVNTDLGRTVSFYIGAVTAEWVGEPYYAYCDYETYHAFNGGIYSGVSTNVTYVYPGQD
jgi:hypothetical protein